MSEHELPAGVRVALWGTAALRGRVPVDELPRRALPDVDEVSGLVEGVQLWASLGERAVLVALPRPGDVAGMPRGPVELVDAATRAQECVFVPQLGGALVPTLETFGPEGDRGWSARWTAYPAEPVPTHRIEALDLGQIELGLRTALAGMTEELLRAGAPPFGPDADRGAARARAVRDGAGSWGLPDGLPPRALRVIDLAGTVLRLADAGLDAVTGSLDAATTAARAVRDGAGSWGLPDGLPPRALRVIDLAGTVLRLADAGLDAVTGSLDAATTAARADVLRRLQGRATTALADATNAAALHLAYRS